ncbi:hypothetical protein FA95DRAFT_1578437 [Auriscalpium vulgare]|uniref:Uncharacterized protein n=1 Tax=Auriscalpium vulgare TaxID=40419 RepID=A0ACB8R219_9AGAM|nr:hypothetical protein FA95DRAFT_1578437 [Auriscalpium vulgare]
MAAAPIVLNFALSNPGQYEFKLLIQHVFPDTPAGASAPSVPPTTPPVSETPSPSPSAPASSPTTHTHAASSSSFGPPFAPGSPSTVPASQAREVPPASAASPHPLAQPGMPPLSEFGDLTLPPLSSPADSFVQLEVDEGSTSSTLSILDASVLFS